MIRYLADTSVLSAFAPGRPELPPDAVDWSRANQSRWFVPTIAVLEIEQGIVKMERLGASRKFAALHAWFRALLEGFDQRIVHFDVPSALAAGVLSDRLVALGRHPGLADIMIAATAKAHDFAVLTRNLRHFQHTGVPVFDPFSPRPDERPE